MGLWNIFKEIFRLLVFMLLQRLSENKDVRRSASATPKYSVKYPEGYTRQYPKNDLNGYRWQLYKTPLNNLYNNDAVFYNAHRFKYRKPKHRYET